MALCKEDQNIYDSFQFHTHTFTAPEAGTIAIYPCRSAIEPMNMLHPHLDSLNGYSRNYNYTVTFSGIFRVCDIKDKSLREDMRKCFGYQYTEWFEIVFIRYSRKIMCDLSQNGSAHNKIDYIIKTSTCKAETDILTFVKDKAYTDWDYDFLMKDATVIGNLQRILNGQRPTVERVEKFELNRLCVNVAKDRAYRYGAVIRNKSAAVNKRCYDSAPADQTYSFLVKFQVTNVECILVMVMLFSLYTAAPSLYIQALESLMEGRYLDKDFGVDADLGDILQCDNCKPLDLANVISKQIGYENKSRKKNEFIAHSSEQRHTHSNIKLPHTVEVDKNGKRIDHFKCFAHSFNFLTKRIKQFWETTQPLLVLSGPKKKSSTFTKKMSVAFYKECASMLRDLCAKVRGAREFTSMVFIQFAGVMGILPTECSTYAVVSNMTNCGSLKFFRNRIDPSCKDTEKPTKEDVERYNDRLLSISQKMRTELSTKYTPDKLENIGCEVERTQNGNRANDPIFLFRHRQKLHQTLLHTHVPHSSSAGLQNFFDVQWDSKTARMVLFISRPTKNGTQATLVPFYEYICVNWMKGTIQYTKRCGKFMPYTAIKEDNETAGFSLIAVEGGQD